MPIAIFYLDAYTGDPKVEKFDDTKLLVVLDRMKYLRDHGNHFVVSASEMADSVGKPGVDSVKDGKTPDGHDYDWSKSHRAGATKKNDATKPTIATRNGD
jgi:hypothetical protein